MIIKSTKQFDKMYLKAPIQIKEAFKKRLELFKANQNHPLLKKHQLKGPYKNYFSINITGDWRAIFQELQNGEIIFFLMLGTHSKLYFK